MPEFTEADVIYLLKNHEYIQSSIKFIEKQIVNLITSKSELIRQLSMPGMNYDNAVGIRFAPKPKIHDVVEDYRSIEIQSLNEAKLLLTAVKEEQEVLAIVMKRMYALPEPYRSVLLMLYLQHEKWDTICRELVISRTTLQQMRDIAVGGIATGQIEPAAKDGGKKEPVKEIEGQMSLQEYLEEQERN